MMPWGHAAVAVLPYAGYRLLTDRALPTKRAILLLLFTTQFPDLIDKPLAWTLHLIPSGRMLAHSVVIAVPLVLLTTAVLVHSNRANLAPLLTFSYLSHLYADSLALLHRGAEYYYLPNIFWPLLEANPDRIPAFLPHVTRISPERYAVVLVGLALLAGIYVTPRLAARLPIRTTPE